MNVSSGCSAGDSREDARRPDAGSAAPPPGGASQVREFWPHPQFAGHFTAIPGTTRLLLSSRTANECAEYFLWDYATKREVWRVAPKERYLSMPVLSPDGRHLLFSEYAEHVGLLWDLGAGREVHRFRGHDDVITEVAFLPDGKRFVTVAEDGSAGVWDTHSRDDENDLLDWFEGHQHRIYSLALSPDGRLAASGDQGGNVIVWDVGTCKTVRRFTPLLQKAWEPGGRIRNSNTGEVMDPPGPRYYVITSLAFFPDSRRVAVGTSVFIGKWQALVLVLDVESGREVARHVEKTETIGGIERCLAVSPDGRRVLFSTGQGPIRLWDVQSGKIIASFAGHVFNRPGYEEVHGKPTGASSIAFSPDGRLAVSGGEDQTIRVWKLPD